MPQSDFERFGNRAPVMHQTKKENRWHFRMKTHLGVEVHSGLLPHVAGVVVNVAGIAMVVGCCMTVHRARLARPTLPTSTSATITKRIEYGSVVDVVRAGEYLDELKSLCLDDVI